MRQDAAFVADAIVVDPTCKRRRAFEYYNYMSTEEIRAALLSAPKVERDLVFRQQADKFEEELLGRDDIPDDYVELFVEIISHPPLAAQSGAWNFIVRVLPDREKLTTGQLERIRKAFESAYRAY